MTNLNMGNTQVMQVVPNAVGSEIVSIYDLSEVSPTDIILVNSDQPAGRKWTTISLDPLTNGTRSRIKSRGTASAPFNATFETSISSRYKGSYGIVYAGSTEDLSSSLVPEPARYAISSIQQATTTLTIVLSSPFLGFVGTWVDITGVPDNRLNYFNLCIATVSRDRLTLTATVNDEATIPSLSVGPYAGVGTLTTIELFGRRNNAAGIRSSGTTATSSACLSRFGGGASVYMTGTPAGSHVVTMGTTAPTFAISATGQYSIQSPTRYNVRLTPREVAFMDKGSDTVAGVYSTRALLSNVKPDDKMTYQLVFEGVCSAAMPIPAAKIVSISKTGTTTATVVTHVPHGLTTSNYVQVYGVRDTVNFPNLATPTVVASVVDPYTFTIVIGGAVTATSYGGGVTVCNGGVLQPGLIAQVVQSAARNADGIVTLIGSASWAGLSVGGLANVFGVRSAVDGSDLGLDGPYRIVTLSTTTIELAPVYDYAGVLRSPSGGVIPTTNCGGVVIDRVELRSQDIGFEAFNDNTVMVMGQGMSDYASALPVNVLMGSISSITGGVGGTAAHAASISGNPVRVGCRGITANYTAVTTGQVADAISTLNGAQIVRLDSIPELEWNYAAAAGGIVNTTTAVTVKAAAGTGIRNYIRSMQVQTDVLTAASELVIRDGASGTVIWRGKLQTGVNNLMVEFTTPLKGTANTLLEVATLTATGASVGVFVNMQGYSAA